MAADRTTSPRTGRTSSTAVVRSSPAARARIAAVVVARFAAAGAQVVATARRAGPGTPAAHFVAGDLTREGLGIAEAVAYLVSDRAGCNIGGNLVIDGGGQRRP
jgi:hypothetical protein